MTPKICRRLAEVKRPDNHPATGFMKAYRQIVGGVNVGCTWLYNED